jgi:hypothetical protein
MRLLESQFVDIVVDGVSENWKDTDTGFRPPYRVLVSALPSEVRVRR